MKNCTKFKLIVAWVGKTSNVKDFGDVTLAGEDEEQERCLIFENFKWKWKYHDVTFAGEDEEQERCLMFENFKWKWKYHDVTLAWKDGLKLNSGPLNKRGNIFKIWIAKCGLTDEELKGHCLADLDRWFETKLKASEEEKHLEIGVAECGMTDEEWKKYCLQSWFGNMVWN